MRFASFLLLCFLPVVAAAQIRIVGSDLLKPVVESALAGYQPKDGKAVVLDMTGSLAGSNAWAEGSADILIEAILPGKPVPHDAAALAYSAVIVLVNKANPITELTLPQLAAIFGQQASVPLQRWSEAGVGGAMGTRSINPSILEDRNTILMDQFRDSVLGNRQLRSTVKRLTSQAEVQLAIGGDNGAIVVTDRLPAMDSSARALPISKGGAGDFAFGPTEQNIHYGEYPLRLGYYIRYNRQNRAELKDVLAALLSEETAQRLVRQGFIPVQENSRKRFLLELDK